MTYYKVSLSLGESGYFWAYEKWDCVSYLTKSIRLQRKDRHGDVINKSILPFKISVIKRETDATDNCILLTVWCSEDQLSDARERLIFAIHEESAVMQNLSDRVKLIARKTAVQTAINRLIKYNSVYKPDKVFLNMLKHELRRNDAELRAINRRKAFTKA